VYVAGISYNTSYDGVVIKYSSSGVEEWVRLHDGPAGGDDLASSVTIDDGGDIYVVGASTGVDTGKDILALRYDPSGTIVWENRYDEWGSPDDAGASVAVEADGTVWITGTSSFPNNEHISTTLKYNQDPVMAVDDSELSPSMASLEQNYPNPFNPATTIRYAIPSAGRVTLRIYSLLGEEVRTLVDGVQERGEHVVSWNSATNSGLPAASGIYFYRLVVALTGKTETLFSRSGKMILLR